MIRRLKISMLVLFIALALTNVYVYLFVGVEPPVNPEAYCDTQSIPADVCIAELPGEFARGVTPMLSLLALVVFPFLQISVEMVFKWIRKRDSIK